MATHLVMGDPHCTPKASNDRFLWAGKLAHDLKPNTIICMGDFASMDSLCSYDKGKKQFEGRRYKKDIDHAHDALDKFNKGLNGRRPRKIMLLGNHEDRIDRTVFSIKIQLNKQRYIQYNPPHRTSSHILASFAQDSDCPRSHHFVVYSILLTSNQKPGVPTSIM